MNRFHVDELFSDDDPEDPPVYSVDSGSCDAAASHCHVPITRGPLESLDLPPGELSDDAEFCTDIVEAPVVESNGSQHLELVLASEDAKRSRERYRSALRRAHAQIHKLREERAQMKADASQSICVDLSKRQFGAHVPRRTTMCVVFRKAAFGYGNLKQIGMWLSDPNLAPSTLRSWEERAASCVLSEALDMHRTHEAALLAPSDDGAVNVSSHAWFADGTNTTLHKGAKLMVSHCMSQYVSGSQSPADCDSVDIWPDAIPILDGSATGVLSILARQFELVGFPMLLKDDTSALGGSVFRLHFGITDAGGDISSAKRMIEAYVNKRPYEHHTSLDCQHHQASLGERRQLKLTDVFSDRWGLPFPYFSTLVKWAHCFKSRYPLIKQTCETLFSPALALRVCGKVVRIPVASRWCSTGDCEEDLSRAELKEYIVIMEAATLPAKGSKKRKAPTGGGTCDELAIEQQAAWTTKRGKWEDELMKVIRLPKFWVLKAISFWTRGPWRHHQHFLHKLLIPG